MIRPEQKIPTILPDDNRKRRPLAKINLYFYTMPQRYFRECKVGNYAEFVEILRKEFKQRFNCNVYGESLSNDDLD